MMQVNNRVVHALFLGFLFSLTVFASEENLPSRAFRPDASTFPVNCTDCCDTDDITDCQFNEAISLLDVIVSDIDVLIELEESCCASATSSFEDLKSDIDALTTFEQTCCTELNSKLDSLTTFEQTCCAELNSKIDAILDCSCCDHMITQADIGAGDTYIISLPGVYCLAEDVTFSTNGFAIQINNTDPEVILDLQGHTIIGSGTGSAIFVTNTSYGTTIQNGSTDNAGIGIELQDATQVFIKNINIASSVNYGIFISSASGNGGGIDVINSFIRDTGVDGIYVGRVGLTRIIDSTVAFSGGSAVHIDSCFQCDVENVRVINTQKHGFEISSTFSSCNAIYFRNCVAESCVINGFSIVSDISNGISVVGYTDCKSFGNNSDGFIVTSGGSSIQSVEYKNCLAKYNNGNGFFAGAGSNISKIFYIDCIAESDNGNGFFIDCQDALIRSCVADTNINDGIHLDVNANNCQVLNNTAVQNQIFGINDLGSSNFIYSNIANANSTNYSPSVPLQLLPTDITGYWINVDSTASTVGEYESKIDAILSCSCCENVITQQMINNGQVVLKESGIYCLADDIISSADVVPIVISNTVGEIILDLGGHSILDPSIATAILISSSTGGVTIRNGTISGVGNAITVTDNSNHVIIENILIYNTSNTSIIIQKGSSDVVIDKVSISGSGSDGIFFVETQALTNFAFWLKDTSVVKSAKAGIHMDGTFTAILENVHSISNGSYGFFTESSSDISQGISYKNCYAEYNKLAGFVLATSTGLPLATISYQDCKSFNNEGPGYSILGSNGTILALNYINCLAMCNVTDGFITGTGSSGSLVHDIVYNNCISQLNRGYGFYIDCQGSMLTHCISEGNGKAGILLDRSSFKWQIMDCIVSFNKIDGIEVIGSNSLVQRCSVGNNVGNGVAIIAGSQNTQVLNSYLFQNSSYGLSNLGTNSYIFGNNSVFNTTGNFNPSIGLAISNTSTYWANVRDPLVP